MNRFRIPLSHTSIDFKGLSGVLSRFEGEPHEEVIKEFENRIGELTSAPYVVALNSGTAAIHMALKALGVTTGDRVPVSTFTYVGSVNPILYLNANPIFIDSEETTWNLDPDLLEKCLKDFSDKGKLPKAMIVVHGYGMPAKMDEILLISKKFDVPIIEDAAEALGGYHKKRSLGSIGDIGILSFNNNKAFTTFGGGALLTKSMAIYERVKFWATQARESFSYYEHKEVGYNYRMSPLNAACGIALLEEVDSILANRRSAFERYKTLLQSDDVQLLEEPRNFFSSRWLTTVLFRKDIDPFFIQKKLADDGIESRPLWKPMHQQPVFRDAYYYGSGVSDKLFESGLCLPSGSNLSPDDLNRVVATIKQLLATSNS